MQSDVRAPVTSVALAEEPSPCGRLVLAATDEALLACAYDTAEAVRRRAARAGGSGVEFLTDADATPGQLAVLTEARAQLAAYLAGNLRSFSVPLDLSLASAFTARTVLALESFVPYGHTATYGELAAVLGRPRAARAVGMALGSNPLCVVLPCHRIVGAKGSLTGYAGGVDAKRFLLATEGAT
ncbi:methylated-DNA--[protein]-cysteine S-methyltransferase [Streptomyces sp. NBRC 110028]|uniref:methylated-DNA--[protein]-cysteine S-methyltransferase n=1 Tax=Streptomyces sp. NBRC 110028 TaxID=1621260 RepID=UPI00099EF37E|nr:methylated-DNA--[protein]-cysteine S-methyltransferase [Streptomyces sp. NBRC 110028]